MRDKVARQCPQTETFEEKGEPKRNRTEVLLLTSLTPYQQAKPAHISLTQQNCPPFVTPSDSYEYAEDQTIVKSHLIIVEPSTRQDWVRFQDQKIPSLGSGQGVQPRMAKTLEEIRTGTVTRMDRRALIRFAVGDRV